MGKNAHIRVPIYQQQQAMRVAAKQFVKQVSSPPDEGAASSPSTFVPAARAGFPATLPATPPATSPAIPTDTATIAISDPTWTWRPSSAHLQPAWAPQPERKCGGHGGDDDNPIAAAAASEDPKRALVHALQNDLSRMLVQLERLDEMLSA